MADHKDDVDSVCSTFSQVSFLGEEMDAQQAVDTSIKQIQDGLNSLQCGMREMLMLDEQDGSYDVMAPKYDEIETLVKSGIELWKDMLSIARQLKPKKPRAAKKDKPPSVLDSCG